MERKLLGVLGTWGSGKISGEKPGDLNDLQKPTAHASQGTAFEAKVTKRAKVLRQRRAWPVEEQKEGQHGRRAKSQGWEVGREAMNRPFET